MAYVILNGLVDTTCTDLMKYHQSETKRLLKIGIAVDDQI